MFTFSITTLFAQSQSEMNNDAFISYKKVDNELGIVYQLILKKFEYAKDFPIEVMLTYLTSV